MESEAVRLERRDGRRTEVAVIEELGHERHLVCRTEGGTLVTVREPVDGAHPAGAMDVGDQVGLALDAEAIHLFRRDDGERIGP